MDKYKGLRWDNFGVECFVVGGEGIRGKTVRREFKELRMGVWWG